MKIGYARVSTENQNLERQIDALHEYGVDELYTEKMTGTKANRPELDKVRLRIREGDSVVVESLSRLGRSTLTLKFMNCVIKITLYMCESIQRTMTSTECRLQMMR